MLRSSSSLSAVSGATTNSALMAASMGLLASTSTTS